MSKIVVVTIWVPSSVEDDGLAQLVVIHSLFRRIEHGVSMRAITDFENSIKKSKNGIFENKKSCSQEASLDFHYF